MGATNFTTVGYGATASEAFSNAIHEAQYQHGHGGYTGTIAEKSRFRVVNVEPEILADKNKLWDKIDELTMNEFSDKWGDAGCIKLEEGKYCFFGFASE